MEAIRRILTVKNNKLDSIQLPMFNGQEVIVSIYPLHEMNDNQKQVSLQRLRAAGGSLHKFANTKLISGEEDAIATGILRQYGTD